jgi:hypothetical protein
LFARKSRQTKKMKKMELEQTVMNLTHENRRLKEILTEQDTLFADLNITPPTFYENMNDIAWNYSSSSSSSSSDSSSSHSDASVPILQNHMEVKQVHNELCALCQCEIHFDPQFLGDMDVLDDYDADFFLI